MSAWIVSKTHIDRMIATAQAWGYITPFDANRLGRTLWVENLKSVAARYPDDVDGTRPGCGYGDEAIGAYVADEARPLTPNEMLSGITCLDYQSCEHDTWKTSEAYAALNDLTALAVSRGADRKSPEYDRAPWGIDA